MGLFGNRAPPALPPPPPPALLVSERQAWQRREAVRGGQDEAPAIGDVMVDANGNPIGPTILTGQDPLIFGTGGRAETGDPVVGRRRALPLPIKKVPSREPPSEKEM